jgi:hypothetical protein
MNYLHYEFRNPLWNGPIASRAIRAFGAITFPYEVFLGVRQKADPQRPTSEELEKSR